MLRIIRNQGTGTAYAIDSTMIATLTSTHEGAFTAAGYSITAVSAASFRVLVIVHGFDPDNLPGNGQRQDKITSIPLTVQGASETFITDRMLQVQNRDDTNANALNLQVIQSKNEILAKLDA